MPVQSYEIKMSDNIKKKLDKLSEEYNISQRAIILMLIDKEYRKLEASENVSN
jgi:predicted transcriptional regulator